MVICFFSTQYLPTPGGVERYTWNLARRCAAAGHRALVVTASLPGLPARERDADGIEIYRRTMQSGQPVTIGDMLKVRDNRCALQIPTDVISAGITPNPR